MRRGAERIKKRGPSGWARSSAPKATFSTCAQRSAQLPPGRHAVLGTPHGLRESKMIHGVSVPSAPRLPPSFAVVFDGECGDSRERRAPLQRWERWEAAVRADRTQASTREGRDVPLLDEGW